MLKNELKLKLIVTCALALSIFSFGYVVYGATPSGVDWFELRISPFTGSDNTGDGGTGLPSDLNYFYVGQTVSQSMIIDSLGTDAANIWVDYDTSKMTVSNLSTGTYFPSWAGQTISGGRIKSTGYIIGGTSSGEGSFGGFNLTFTAPGEASYATSAPTILDINVGIIGDTTESNISLLGTDILDDAEDFQMHIWADTIKPFVENPSPANAAIGVAIDSLFNFDLRDTLNGEGDNSGVGTGVNTTEPPGSITYDSGGGPVDLTGVDSFACSGIWGTNLCSVIVNPNAPSGIAGDSRNWGYGTSYTLTVSGFQDLASSSQDQLGDANGPNTMNTKIWTFTTESDTVAPKVSAEIPSRGSVGVSPSTNITIDIADRKSYPNGPSGVGVNPASCSFTVQSNSFGPVTYTQGDSDVTVSSIDYGYRFVIDPASNFAENETVSVTAFNCADTATVPNVMTTDIWTFSTSDSQPPYIVPILPLDDGVLQPNDTIQFRIKDDGAGVDLSNLVIYINGEYYSNGGGAVSVTGSGTIISSATSLDFNGSNYAGDTTGISGTVNDYLITIDPQSDFVAGEGVPIAIYARDVNGNLMARALFVGVVAGSSGASSYCGANTSWDGSQCVGTGGGSGGGTSGGGHMLPLQVTYSKVIQVDENSVLISWYTNKNAQGYVVYDEVSHSKDLGIPPSFGYTFDTDLQEDTKTYRTEVITGLEPGKLYYFKAIARIGNSYAYSDELIMAPLFTSEIIRESDDRVSELEDELFQCKENLERLKGQKEEKVGEKQIIEKEKIEKGHLELRIVPKGNTTFYDNIPIFADEDSIEIEGIGPKNKSLQLYIY